jgi:hypothetical protein
MKKWKLFLIRVLISETINLLTIRNWLFENFYSILIEIQFLLLKWNPIIVRKLLF